MTQDYKKNLIDYVIGQLDIQTGTQKDINVAGTKYYPYDVNSMWSTIRTQLSSIGTTLINGVLQSDNYDVSIVYGSIFIDNNTPDRGFLIYLDNNLIPIKLITTYKTGNNLEGIHKLFFDEGANRCYGILGGVSASISTSTITNRFTFLNNLFYKGNDYEVDLRTSYDIGDNNFLCTDMIKDPEGANYLIIGSNPANKIGARAIELKINVSTGNEWNRWTSSETQSHNMLVGCYGSYSNNEPSFKIFTFNMGNYKLGLLYNTGSTLNKTDLTDIRINNISNIFLGNRPLEYQSINANEVYFSIPLRWQLVESGETYRGQLSVVYKYDGTNISELYRTDVAIGRTEGGTTTYPSTYQLNIVKDTDNTIYLLRYYANETTNNTSLSVLNLTNHMNSITEDDWVIVGSYYYLNQITNINQTTFLIRKYNIATLCSLTSYIYYAIASVGFELQVQNLSPLNGYNGDPYTSVDSLCPLVSNLYSNGSLVFSRNVYNISKQNNTTTASVEIPNNFLNDVSITTNILQSKTNLIMDNDSSEWTKNVYEIVDLNFLNTISVIDNDIGTQYMESAIKVNNAITDGGNTNYQNTPCNKYRINYVDSTSAINDLTWSSIDDLHKQTSISLSVSKEINSIDFISHDESTIYLTIPLNVEVGKNYTISQKIRIGE